jgi:methylthioribose-1-phosphate isomerase
MSGPVSNTAASALALLERNGASSVCPLRWEGGFLYLLDQRRLPEEEIWLSYTNASEVAGAIRSMVVRGAPAIGIAAAFGLVLEAYALQEAESAAFDELWMQAAGLLQAARPTAVNLMWAVRRMVNVFSLNKDMDRMDLPELLEKEALAIWNEDVAANLLMGRMGASLCPAKVNFLTHCNAGALATGGYGTALGVVRACKQMGKTVHVFADETRPWLQGVRLTAWELMKDGIPVTVIVDSAAATLMRQERVNAVIVGADRIAANGDVANKIGTYSLAVLAKAHNIPFYVAAPISTIDYNMDSGVHIPIEERAASELVSYTSFRPDIHNPVFDVTPNELVTAIITERGVLVPPFSHTIKAVLPPLSVQ